MPLSRLELFGWLLALLAVAVVAVATVPDGWHKLALHLARALGGH